MAGGDWKDSGMEGTLKQGAISSQPLPLSALGATDKLVCRLVLITEPQRVSLMFQSSAQGCDL